MRRRSGRSLEILRRRGFREIADSGVGQKKKEAVSIKLLTAVYKKCFADWKVAETADIVEKALEAWFRKKAVDII